MLACHLSEYPSALHWERLDDLRRGGLRQPAVQLDLPGRCHGTRVEGCGCEMWAEG